MIDLEESEDNVFDHRKKANYWSSCLQMVAVMAACGGGTVAVAGCGGGAGDGRRLLERREEVGEC